MIGFGLRTSRWMVTVTYFVGAMLIANTIIAQGRDPEVELGVTTGHVQLMPIEMENFVTPGLPGEAPRWLRQLDDILHRDLDYSDLFRITRWYLYPGEPAESSSRALVRGSIERAGESWILRGRVEELPGQRLIFQTEYAFTRAGARDLVHQFADDVVDRLTGQVGISRTRVTFVRVEGDAKEIWLIDSDGASAERITSNGSINLSPAWSPDGSKLLYTTYTRGSPELAEKSLVAGTSRWVSTAEGLNIAGEYSPDGSRVALTLSHDGDADIYVLPQGGGEPRRLTRTRGIDTAPTWSPTGAQIGFVSDRSGSPQIYLMDSGGGALRRLTFSGSYNASPAWSPRGDQIAFVSRDTYMLNVYVIGAGGDGLRPIVYGRGESENPSWAPDGRHLVYSCLRGGERGLYVIDIATGRERPLTSGLGDCYGPAWSPVPPGTRR